MSDKTFKYLSILLALLLAILAVVAVIVLSLGHISFSSNVQVNIAYLYGFILTC
jgi:hypothetical protein